MKNNITTTTQFEQFARFGSNQIAAIYLIVTKIIIFGSDNALSPYFILVSNAHVILFLKNYAY